jgi:Asp-tRNA(Asn)/Glu-tRNA(Gln) amidotransferase A subunit family amidase
VSLPAGFDDAGLPIGIQLLGAGYSEGTLLRIGRSYEQLTESDAWRQEKPAIVQG